MRPLTRSESGRLGGLQNTDAKRDALAILHASRRGVRIHKPSPDWTRLHRRLQRLLSQPDRTSGRSRRALAMYLGVADSTVRRWLAGVDIPHPERVPAIRAWIARHLP